MKTGLLKLTVLFAAVGFVTSVANAQHSEGPWLAPPHGVFDVTADGGQVGVTGVSSPRSDMFGITNKNGHVIFVSAAQIFENTDENVGGIREADSRPGGLAGNVFGFPDPAFPTPSSTTLISDDGGFSFSGLPEDTVMTVNVVGTLMFHDGGANSDWAPATGDKTLTVFDLTSADEATGAVGDVPDVAVTGATSGPQGSINLVRINNAGTAHGHLGYQLEEGGAIPETGAYMLELSISATEFGSGTTALLTSEPIFMVFNNSLDLTGVINARDAAAAIPEPSTAMFLAAIGAGITFLPRRKPKRAAA